MMNNNIIVVGNWKMNPEPGQMVGLAYDIEDKLVKADLQDKVQIVICPPFIGLGQVLDASTSNLLIGAQNGWSGDRGAFTGEISMGMLSQMRGNQNDQNIKFVIVGHSERRRWQGETSELINQKVKSALECNLTPILCVGEFNKIGDDQAIAGDEKVNIFLQLEKSLSDLSPQQISQVVVAYEPVWAIGTGDAATGEYAAKMTNKLRDKITNLSNQQTAQKIKIIYGGSVTAENAAEYATYPTINGALVGGASLSAGEFVKIVKAFSI